MHVKVLNEYLRKVEWLSAGLCDFKLSNTLDVWEIKIEPNLAHLNYFTTLLTDGEIDRSNRYHQLRDRNRFIVSRGSTRILLAKYAGMSPNAVDFTIGANKKPFLKDFPLFFNVSHSGEKIMLVVSDSETGVDIEYINSNFNFADIVNEYFSDEEIAFINHSNSTERFFLLWTRKEALTKASGKGLDDDLKSIPSLNGVHAVSDEIVGASTNLVTRSFKIDDAYFASVCSEDQEVNLRFFSEELIINL